jgi:predicted Zn-dependent protease
VRKGKKVLALLVLLGTVAGGIQGYRLVSQRLERRHALQWAEQGQFSDAEPILRRTLERQAEDVAVLQALARGLLSSDKWRDAEPYLSRWCALRPDDTEPFKLRMDLHHRRGRAEPTAANKQRILELALQDGQRVLEIEPHQDDVRQEVAWLCLSVGRYDDAERHCRRCLEQQPDYPWLLYLLAEIRHAQGDRTEAAALLDRVVPHHPGFTRGLFLRAVLYYESDQAEKAVPLLRRVLELDKDRQIEGRYHLSLALARIGRTEEAQHVLAEMRWLQLGKMGADQLPDSPAVQVQIAESMLGVGKADEALRVLDKVLKEDPANRGAHRLLAEYYEKQGQASKAAQHRCRAEE